MKKVFLNQSEVGFADEIAASFYYESNEKIIEIGFSSFFHNGEYCNAGCKLRVAAWKSAKSRLHESQKFQNLEANLGIVSLLLSLDVIGENVVMIVNTVDNRYVEWHFEGVCFEVEKLNVVLSNRPEP